MRAAAARCWPTISSRITRKGSTIFAPICENESWSSIIESSGISRELIRQAAEIAMNPGT